MLFPKEFYFLKPYVAGAILASLVTGLTYTMGMLLSDAPSPAGGVHWFGLGFYGAVAVFPLMCSTMHRSTEVSHLIWVDKALSKKAEKADNIIQTIHTLA